MIFSFVQFIFNKEMGRSISGLFWGPPWFCPRSSILNSNLYGDYGCMITNYGQKLVIGPPLTTVLVQSEFKIEILCQNRTYGKVEVF